MKTGRPRAVAAAAVLLRGAAGIVAVGVLWELVVRVGGIKPYYLPSLSSILQAIAALPATYAGSFLRTLSETVLGYAAGAVVGVVNGVIFHRVRLLRELVFPLFIISQTIPVIAFGAVVVLTMLATHAFDPRLLFDCAEAGAPATAPTTAARPT